MKKSIQLFFVITAVAMISFTACGKSEEEKAAEAAAIEAEKANDEADVLEMMESSESDTTGTGLDTIK